ncbi:unnamed protein product [Boreogadus saida]
MSFKSAVASTSSEERAVPTRGSKANLWSERSRSFTRGALRGGPPRGLHIQMSSPSEPAPAGHQQCVTDRPTGACGGSLLRGFNLAPAGPRVRPPVNAAAAAAIV